MATGSLEDLVRRGCAFVSLGLVAVVVAVLVVEAAPWFSLSSPSSEGMLPLVAGTVLSAAIAIAVAAPVGLLAAIHLSEFTGIRSRGILMGLLELVALVPTLVWGYFALTVVTPALRGLVPSLADQSALSAGIVLGVMLTPMIAAHSAEALAAVPLRLREGALALGAGEAQTILTIVIPAAAPGVAASILLALSRALGEAMIVLIAAGHRPILTLDPRVPIESMSAHIVEAAHAGSASDGAAHAALFGVGLALLVLTALTSLIAKRVSRWRAEEARP